MIMGDDGNLVPSDVNNQKPHSNLTDFKFLINYLDSLDYSTSQISDKASLVGLE